LKTEEEIADMRRAMEANEAAVRDAVEMIAASEIRDGMLHDAEGPLTSERVKKRIARGLHENGYIASQTIVAAGDQGCNPHNAGSGRLPAHTPIIIDVFPRSRRTRYCADITRTVVRGKASDRVRRMFDAVLAAQHIVFDSLADGVDGGAVHRKVEELFDGRGFPTGPNSDGRMEGFFHGTGHGLGLEIHELPRFNRSRSVFRAGMVVTVEPGLYYLGTGGVRLEDVVVIRERGCENLCTLEKRLEI
jgi:Xaa-Pro aminopeptidase